MKKVICSLLLSATIAMNAENPFFRPFDTVLETPPFDSITNSDYEPAIDRGITLAKQEIDAIVANTDAPTFANTIVAYERAGADLNRVLNVFYPILSAMSDDELMDISMRVSAKLSDYETDISLNEGLWQRVKAVYETTDRTSLSPEDATLLQRTYDSFVRSGANLQGTDRDKYRALQAELSEQTTKFGQNVKKELATYEIELGADDLTGLPQSFIDAAALTAKERGKEGKYILTLAQPTYMAFMKYSDRPDLREKIYRLYTCRNTSGEYNNLPILARIADLRRQVAQLLGYKTYADYQLEQTMAGTPQKVYDLLDNLRDAYKPAQQKEFAELREFASGIEGHPVDLNAWDYSYYANKLKNAKYDFNEEELRPYFELGNVIKGVFGLATKLYGLKFTERSDIQVYHPDVKAFEVTDAEGKYVGVLYTDFFPRDSKSPGAWMTDFRAESIDDSGVKKNPHVTIVMNFTKPTADSPSLLTPYEVETFLHEFGHALHGLLADTRYASLSGTNVYRDFVELPSQFNENYLTQKEFLDGFARHYQTGEPIPQTLVDRIIKSSQFGAAYSCMRQLGFGYLDMAFYSATDSIANPAEFERRATAQVNMFPEVEGSLMAPQFGHIFSGGYAAGYYSYKWAEVLDADAFSFFEERGIFNKEAADSFRKNVLTRGGTEDPAELYRRFRGQDPTIDALLRRDGIIPPAQPQVKLPKRD